MAFLNASRKYKGHEALKQDPSTALRFATLFRKHMGGHNCTQGRTSTTALTNHQHTDRSPLRLAHHEAKLGSKMKRQDSSPEGYRLRVHWQQNTERKIEISSRELCAHVHARMYTERERERERERKREEKTWIFSFCFWCSTKNENQFQIWKTLSMDFKKHQSLLFLD